MRKIFTLKNFHTIALDFDGVFTNNKVYVTSSGDEFVRCDRSDSFGLNMLREYISINKFKIDLIILSREKSSVVLARAKKLNINCYHGISNKKTFLDTLFRNKKITIANPFEGLIYLGNDLNDLPVMSEAGFSMCPNDSHELIKQVAHRISKKNGGDGFIRDFVEFSIKLNKLSKRGLYELISYSWNWH